MRKEMVERTSRGSQVKSLKQAKKLAPWAARFLKVEGGYLAFEDVRDYQTYKNQK